MKTKRQRQGMPEEVITNPGCQALADSLNVEALDTLQPHPQQDADQQKADQQTNRCRDREPLQPRQAGLTTKHADRLTNQERLHSPGQSDGDQKQEGEQQTPPVMTEITTEAHRPLPVADNRHQPDTPAVAQVPRIASTTALRSPPSSRRESGWPTSRAVE